MHDDILSGFLESFDQIFYGCQVKRLADKSKLSLIQFESNSMALAVLPQIKWGHGSKGSFNIGA